MNYKEELKKLLENAYSPYYKFPVAVILVAKDGNTFRGVNVEASTSDAGMCAERVALGAAVTLGYKKGDFKELYVMTKGDEISFPCFVCRQQLIEFFTGEEKIISINKNDEHKEVLFKELTPYAFDGDDLK